MNAQNTNLDAVNPEIRNTTEGKDIILEAEKLKSKYLLNAISILISEIPDLQAIIEEPLAESGIQIPQRPETGINRPITGSSRGGSRQSNRSSQRG